MVEDDKVNSLVAQRLLENEGYVLVPVFNGQEAIERLRNERFDIILMDVQMPVLDGTEATRIIRSGKAGEDNKDIPIIALTAHAMKGDKERFLESGMNSYVSKPLEIETLNSVIGEFLRQN